MADFTGTSSMWSGFSFFRCCIWHELNPNENERTLRTDGRISRSFIHHYMDVAGGPAGAGMMVFTLPIPRIPALLLIFGIAGFKATLVLRDYMHLKGEKILIYVIALTPLVLAIALALVLIPDIVFRR